MKIFVICCNYNEVRLGHLPDSLEALKLAKIAAPESVYIGVTDNASKDGSPELLRRYHEMGIIDCLQLNPRNLGKPRALNLLWHELEDRCRIKPYDLIMSLDSDIKLLRTDFFLQLQRIAYAFKDEYSGIGVPVLDHDYGYVKLELCQRRFIHPATVWMWPYSDGVCGFVAVAPAHAWRAIGGYREDCGRNHTSAIYGADDCMLFRDLFAYSGGKPLLMPDVLTSLHPKPSDPGYQAWKDRTNAIMNRGFGNPDVPDVGYFDDQEQTS